MEEIGKSREQQDKPDLSEHLVQKFIGREAISKNLDFSDEDEDENKNIGSMTLNISSDPGGTLTVQVHGGKVMGHLIYLQHEDSLEVTSNLYKANDAASSVREELPNTLEARRKIEKFLLSVGE